MENHASLIVLLYSVMSVPTSYATGNCLATVDMSRLREAVGKHSEFYGDLPSRIDCSKPQGNQAIVCNSDVLRFMEKLDHMGGVYAYENGTKREFDHSKPYGVSGFNKMLNSCDTAECICTKFKEWADSAFGGLSPYVADSSYNTNGENGVKSQATRFIYADGARIEYDLIPDDGRFDVVFHVDGDAFRNVYRLDCSERRFLWIENIDLNTGLATDRAEGAKWRAMNPGSVKTNAVYDTACRDLSMVTSAEDQRRCVVNTPYVPSGWCQPTESDMVGDWFEFRHHIPSPYHAVGWFDENDTKDEAWILYREDGTEWGIFLFLNRGDGFVAQQIERFSFSDFPLQTLSVTTIEPGTHKTACGYGYWECGPSEPAEVQLRANGLMISPYEKGGAYLVFWDDQGFDRVILTD